MGWNPRVICCRTRDFRSRDGACRGLARPRRMPPLAPTPGAHRSPGLPALSSSRTSSHATLFRSRAVFPADSAGSSDPTRRVAGCWAVRARANPLSLGVWHFTLRFVLPRSWVGYPRRRPKGCGMQLPSGPKVYPKSLARKRATRWPAKTRQRCTSSP